MNKNKYIYIKPFDCDLLVYDKDENVFYEYFANFDLDEERKTSKFLNAKYYIVLYVLSLIIDIVFIDFFNQLNLMLYISLIICGVVLGLALGILMTLEAITQQKETSNKILHDSSFSILEKASMDRYLNLFKLRMKNSIILKVTSLICLGIVAAPIVLYRPFMGFIIAIFAVHIWIPILFEPSLFQNHIWFILMNKKKKSLD